MIKHSNTGTHKSILLNGGVYDVERTSMKSFKNNSLKMRKIIILYIYIYTNLKERICEIIFR